MTRTHSLVLCGNWFPLILLVCCLACGRSERAAVGVPPGTPVVLISIDTLRADRLPAYGYQEVATPGIDSLRRDAILFANAYSHVPFTLPSHISILTGLLPPEHQVRDNVGYTLDASEIPYLPRVFQRLGYATGAAVSAYVLNGRTGLSTTWDLYDDNVQLLSGRDLGGLHRRGDETLSPALEWVDSIGEKPFFLFFHIYEPHTPYEAPEPFASRYSDFYDAEVAAADAVIGKLLAGLKERDLYDRSVILLLSDHGEGLGDHGDLEHNLFLYREVLQVPLILKLPQAERGGDTVESPVQLTDVFPTLTDLLGVEPPAAVRGTSLLEPALTGADAPVRQLYAENFYPRIHFGWSELTSLIEWPFHLIDGPDPELYNLQEDPRETRNLLRDERRLFRRLRQGLREYDRQLNRPQEVDVETREKLAALGYIGGAATESSGPRPDPKSKLGTFNRLRRAFKSFAEDNFEQAAEEFHSLVVEEPHMVAAWRYLGRALRRLDRREEAWSAYQEALRLSDGAPEVARGAADLLLEMGRLEEAKAHAQLALPAYKLAYGLLADIALRQGKLEEAATYSEQVMTHRGTHLSPLITRARVLVELERFEEALTLTRQAEEEFGERDDTLTLRGLFLTRGRAHADLGEAAEAERAFRREIELFPRSFPPYTHLALLYALTGQGGKAGGTLRELVETNPSPFAYAEAVRTLRLMGDSRSAAQVLRQAQRRWPESQDLSELSG